jgi:phage/plasmid-associated DNA primase
MADGSDGVWRRMRVLAFDAKIPEGAKVRGMDKPEWWLANACMPGILNWALTGLARLKANGWQFTRTSRGEEVKRELRAECNPVLAFLRGIVVADRACNDLSSAQLYEAYRTWCADNGHTHPLGNTKFTEVVKRAIKSAHTKARKVSGKTAQYWFGVRYFDPDTDTGRSALARPGSALRSLLERLAESGGLRGRPRLHRPR